MLHPEQDPSNSLWTPGKLEISLPEPLTEDLGREARSKVQDGTAELWASEI